MKILEQVQDRKENMGSGESTLSRIDREGLDTKP